MLRTLLLMLASAWLALPAQALVDVHFLPSSRDLDILANGPRGMAECAYSGITCTDTSLGSLKVSWSPNVLPPDYIDLGHCVSQAQTTYRSVRRVATDTQLGAFESVWQYAFRFNCAPNKGSFDWWVKIRGNWEHMIGYFLGPGAGDYMLVGSALGSVEDIFALPDELRACRDFESPVAGTCPAAGTTPGGGGGGGTAVNATLTVAKAGSGTGTVSSNPVGIDCGPTCATVFNLIVNVTLTATPSGGSVFAGWSGVCSGTSATTTVAMLDVYNNPPGVCTATFNLPTANTFALSVSKAGSGTGTVTSSPAGVSCGSTCSANFASGASVTLTAAAASGSTFAGWSGACGGTAASVAISMTAARSCTATFNASPSGATAALTVNKAGAGSGTVTSSPSGISCGGTCSASFASNTSVTLSASAASGSAFSGWSGACSGSGASATVSMTAAKSCTATFSITGPVTLSVIRVGSGTGSVSSSPSGFLCTGANNGACNATFAANTKVTLSSTADPGSVLSGWEGDCAGGSSTVVTMDRSRVCTIHFDRPEANLFPNGNFEGGGSGWIQAGGPIGQQIVTNVRSTGPIIGSVALNGDWSARFGGAVPGGDYSIWRQDVDVPAGTSFLQFWYSITTPAASRVGSVMKVIVITDTQAITLASFDDVGVFFSGMWKPSPPLDMSAFAGTRIQRLIFSFHVVGGDPSLNAAMFKLDDISLTAVSTAGATNYTAMWWNPAESGWGINFAHQDDTLFATVFTYDASGAPTWFVMPNGRKQAGAETFTGELYKTKGPAFNTAPFRPIGADDVTQVGTMTVAFSGRDNATLTYSVGGASVTKAIEKQAFGPHVGKCVIPRALGGRSNLTGMWWNPDENGWGLNLTQQSDQVFATIFTYGANGQPLWLVMPNGLPVKESGNWDYLAGYKGELFQTTGPAFNAVPFTPISSANVRSVGTMAIYRSTFSPAESVDLIYSIDGVSVFKTLVRQTFDGYAPVCGS